MLALLVSWWRSSGSSNMLTILILVAGAWFTSEQISKKNEAEALVAETAAVLETHNQAPLTNKDLEDELAEELAEFEEEIDETESEYLSSSVPSDIRRRL